VRLEGFVKWKKKINDLIGNRNLDLPARSIVPQAIALPRPPAFSCSDDDKIQNLPNWMILNQMRYVLKCALLWDVRSCSALDVH
jgi:hypothetical protein